MTPTARIRCPACGTEQEAAATAASCEICGTPLAGGGAAEVVEVLDLDAVAPELASSSMARSAAHAEGIAELAAMPSSAGAEALEELVQIDKRIATLRSLVPIWGPLQLWRSDLHGDGEKLGWTAISLLVTIVLAIGLLSVLPSDAERAAVVHGRVDADLATLAGLVERYREDSGQYPDQASWQSSVERGDARFIDPWGRPYGYRIEAGEFVLETLGADGASGGGGDEADVTRRYPLATPR